MDLSPSFLAEEVDKARELDHLFQSVATQWGELENDYIASDSQLSKRKLCQFAVDLHKLFEIGTPEAYVTYAGMLIQNVCTHNLLDTLIDRDWMPPRSLEQEPLKPIFRILGTLFTIHTCHRSYANYLFAHHVAKTLHESMAKGEAKSKQKFEELLRFFELYGYTLLDIQKTAAIIATIQKQCDEIVSSIKGRDLFVDLRTAVETDGDDSDDDDLRETHFFSWHLCRKYVFDQ